MLQRYAASVNKTDTKSFQKWMNSFLDNMTFQCESERQISFFKKDDCRLPKYNQTINLHAL